MIRDFIEHIKTHHLKYISGFLVFSSVGFAWYMSSRNKLSQQSLSQQQQPAPQRTRTQGTDSSNIPMNPNAAEVPFGDSYLLTSSYQETGVFDKQLQLARAVQMVEITSPGVLSFEQIRAIYIHSIDIVKDEYAKFTREVRKRRRLIRKVNQQQYLGIILDYHAKVQELLERGRMELAEALGVDPDRFDESIYQVQHGQFRTDFLALDQTTKKMLKQMLRRRRRVSDKIALEILKYELEFLTAHLYDRYEKLLKEKSVSERQIINAIHTIIQDLIYEKFGYEEEHIIVKRVDPNFYSREQVAHLLDAIKRENEKMVGELAGFNTPYQTIDYD